MSKFTAFLAALGIAPKTLTDANAQLATAKAQSESVAALFAAASLDLDALLSEGPAALKTKIEAGKTLVLTEAGVAHQEAITAVQAQLAEANTKLSAASAAHAASASQLSTLNSQLSAAGVTFEKPEALGAALTAHVQKQTTLELAKSGHPPVAHVVPADAAPVGADGKPLTGLARTRAAFVAQAAAKAKRN